MKTRAQELGEALAKDLDSMSDHAQSDIAKALNVSQQTISNWKTGKHLPRPPKLLKLHDVFGTDTNTGKVLEHIVPTFFISHPDHDHDVFANLRIAPFDEHLNTSGEHIQRYRGDMRKVRGEVAAGRMSAGAPSSPPPMDSDNAQGHQVSQSSAPYGITSFEQHSVGEMHEALSRAAKGVDLARQVLDDASVQLAKAMQQLQKV